ncbi:MAG: hypothetical protein J6X55_15885, partial [Victivallales bacterium]|nr:hypothetical protein [Victivallales bacterium]
MATTIREPSLQLDERGFERLERGGDRLAVHGDVWLAQRDAVQRDGARHFQPDGPGGLFGGVHDK